MSPPTTYGPSRLPAVRLIRRPPRSCSASGPTTLPTHSVPPSTASESGARAGASGEPTTSPESGSRRVTVPSAAATHTACSDTARSSISLPSEIGAPRTPPVAASIRMSVLSPRLATHTLPPPAESKAGWSPTGMLASTVRVAASTRETVSSPLFATQTDPPVTTTAAGSRPVAVGGPVARSPAGSISRSFPRRVVGGTRRDRPDAAATDVDRRRQRERHVLDDLPGRRLEVVDPPDDGHRVGDPDGIRADARSANVPTSEIDPRFELVDLPARDRQSHQMVPELGQRPHASRPGGQDVGVVGEVDRRTDDLPCRVRRRAAGARERPGGDHRAERDCDDRSGRPQADEEGRPARTPVAPATGLDGARPHQPPRSARRASPSLPRQPRPPPARGLRPSGTASQGPCSTPARRCRRMPSERRYGSAAAAARPGAPRAPRARTARETDGRPSSTGRGRRRARRCPHGRRPARPRICSGATYAIVPTHWPVLVSPSPLAASRVRPKSVRYACSAPPTSATRTLAGLTSRWTRPRAWAASRASPTWATIAAARAGSSAPSRRSASQVRPVDEAHGDEELPVLLAGAVHGYDVRVLEPGCDPALPDEALPEADIIGERRRDHLEGDEPSERQIVCAIDDPHPAAPGDRRGRDTRRSRLRRRGRVRCLRDRCARGYGRPVDARASPRRAGLRRG